MINVTCAIILLENKILVTQRSEKMSLPLKWEFPGGKVEKNESEEDCIIREISEELNLGIDILEKLQPKEFDYTSFSIRLIPFVSKYRTGEIKLSEHKNYLWLLREELHSLDWAPADVPILEDFLKTKYGTGRVI